MTLPTAVQLAASVRAGTLTAVDATRAALERIEAGASTQLTNFLRLLRALDLYDGLELLLPATAPSPITLLELQGRERQRASTPRSLKVAEEPWTWDD